jgi:hypothetical protein
MAQRAHDAQDGVLKRFKRSGLSPGDDTVCEANDSGGQYFIVLNLKNNSDFNQEAASPQNQFPII